MKKMLLIPLLILALLLAACADTGAGSTPGALGTETGLGTAIGTETGLGTETGAATAIGTAVGTEDTAGTVQPTMEATTEATTAATSEVAATPAGQVTSEATSGLVAVPFALFDVAGATGLGTPAADTGTQEAGDATQPAGTQAAGTPIAGDATQPAVAGTQIAGQGDENRTLVRASDILNSDVVDMNGAMVGTVTDVLVDETGVIQHVVLDAGDFLAGTGATGTGGDTGAGTQAAGTAAPAGTNDQSTQVVGTIEAVTPEGTAGAGTQAAGTPDAVSTSTVGSGTALPNTGVMANENTVLVFNGTADDLQNQGVMVPETALSADSVMIDATGADLPADLTTLDGLLRVSGLTDFNVMNAQDEDLGEVEEWIVDVQQGMLEYGVVDFGGFLGIAENSVAVPWEQFNLSALSGATADASLTLDVTQDTLENAPQLNMSDWPAWPQSLPMDWETETRTFWETAS